MINNIEFLYFHSLKSLTLIVSLLQCANNNNLVRKNENTKIFNFIFMKKKAKNEKPFR
jgi:hypothetical protein